MRGMSKQQQSAQAVPPLYWLVQVERHEFLRWVLEGNRLFCFFTAEANALDFRIDHRLGQDWAVRASNNAEYLLKMLDAASPGFDLYVIDPPTIHGALTHTHTLEEMKDEIQRRAAPTL